MQWILRTMIGVVLWLVPSDELRAAFVESVALAGKPRAQLAFEHYRHGDGVTLHISTAALLREDAGLRDALLRRLHAGDTGRIAVSQRMATHDDWRCVLGSTQFDCTRIDAGVEVVARTRYAWHPDQPRITRPIHRLAARLAHRGARPFAIVGDRAVIDDATLHAVLVTRALPVRTYLL